MVSLCVCVCSVCMCFEARFFVVYYQLSFVFSFFLLFAFVYFLLLVYFFVQFSHKKLKYTNSQLEAPAYAYTTHTHVYTYWSHYAHICICDGHCTRCLSSFAQKRPSLNRGERPIGAQLVLCVCFLYSLSMFERRQRIVSYQIKSDKLANSELSIECAPFVSGTYISQ